MASPPDNEYVSKILIFMNIVLSDLMNAPNNAPILPMCSYWYHRVLRVRIYSKSLKQEESFLNSRSHTKTECIEGDSSLHRDHPLDVLAETKQAFLPLPTYRTMGLDERHSVTKRQSITPLIKRIFSGWWLKD